MALQDILAAISHEADARIKQERSTHQKRISVLREESERRIAKLKQNIALQKEERKLQMRRKAEAHIVMIKRNAELQTKRKLLDKIYTAVVERLAGMPEDKVKTLLEKCLKTISQKGDIRPSAAHVNMLKQLASSEQFSIGDAVDVSGGFIFTSEKEERDFTFEHLVSQYLRPKSEVDTASTLFAAA